MTPIAIMNPKSRSIHDRWLELDGAPMTLQQARDAYGRGEIDMAQGRANGITTQYIERRKVKDRPRNWFVLGGHEHKGERHVE